MTIYFDPGTVIVAVISSVISILATWYFARKYYTGESRPTRIPLTTNEALIQPLKYVFWFCAMTLVFMLLLFALLVVASAIRSNGRSEVNKNPAPATQLEYPIQETEGPPVLGGLFRDYSYSAGNTNPGYTTAKPARIATPKDIPNLFIERHG